MKKQKISIEERKKFVEWVFRQFKEIGEKRKFFKNKKRLNNAYL
jgi:hypothetical protein